MRLSKHSNKGNGSKTFDCIYYDIWRDATSASKVVSKCMAEGCGSTTVKSIAILQELVGFTENGKKYINTNSISLILVDI